MTVRTLGACEPLKIQEFARIIFVDNIYNYTTKHVDQKPLKKRPSYESVTPKLVCCQQIINTNFFVNVLLIIIAHITSKTYSQTIRRHSMIFHLCDVAYHSVSVNVLCIDMPTNCIYMVPCHIYTA